MNIAVRRRWFYLSPTSYPVFVHEYPNIAFLLLTNHGT